MDILSYILTFTEGLLTFISPCILPLLPVYFFYLAGVSEYGTDAGPLKRSRLLYNSVSFVIGFTIIFVLLGATATSLGHFLKDNIGVFRKISGAIMVAFGLNFMGILKLNFMNFEKRINYEFRELRFLNSIIFGMVFAFGWTPCLGSFLGSALLTAGSSDTILQGVLLLLAYSIGLGVPFIVTSIVFEKVKNAFREIQKHNRIISIISGIVLILAGLLALTDNLKYLSYFTL